MQIVEHMVQSLEQSGSISRSDQEADVFNYKFLRSSAARGKNGSAARQRFRSRSGKRFGEAGKHEQISLPHELRDLCSAPGALERYHVAKLQVCGPPFISHPLLSVSDDVQMPVIPLTA